jgi:hypothetical protein
MRTHVSDVCLTLNVQVYSYSIARTSYIRWSADDIRFVLDQHMISTLH